MLPELRGKLQSKIDDSIQSTAVPEKLEKVVMGLLKEAKPRRVSDEQGSAASQQCPRNRLAW